MYRQTSCLMLALLFILTITSNLFGQQIYVNKAKSVISISTKSGDLNLAIEYKKGCLIQSLSLKGTQVLSTSGAFTGLQIGTAKFSSAGNKIGPQLVLTDSSVTLKQVHLTTNNGNRDIKTTENWTFIARQQKILWKIDRTYDRALIVEDMSYPQWNFKDLSVWEGGIINNGGIIWCKYLKGMNDTYGVHAGGTTFWNKKTGDGISIQPVKDPTGKSATHIATKYTQTPAHAFSMTNLVSPQSLAQRYRLDRFVAGKSDVFAPFKVDKGNVSVTYALQYENYFDQYERGHLAGIDAAAVRDLLNTTARYGVVDDSIVGGNGWLTNWKCLHEPFFAQIAMALEDTNYNKSLEATLDREMRLAIQPDGRVLSRWHNEPGDEMPGTYNAHTGYYEAKWGYTIDCQPGYVINVSDLFNLTGNIKWLKTHQPSCEKALEWLIRRDENNNGIFEMKNKNIRDATCSDWLDIVWASYENAFVNAQMYGALIKWADCEEILKNKAAAKRYRLIAQRLKTAFNKPVNEGGLWMPQKNQFAYWRDQDGSIHGDNLVTPVQFAVIAFGICDDSAKIAQILTQIESKMEKEQLFHWPLCFSSYRKDEVSAGNWPFPNYENGDIFLTWGYLGVKSYAAFNKDLAVHYIQKLLAQYKKDGLSFQRYDRIHQQGQGNDILAGNATGITALYSDIFGIQPRWNRLTIAPHLPAALEGSQFVYTLRGKKFALSYFNHYCQVSIGQSKLLANTTFGVSKVAKAIRFYPGDQDTCYALLPQNPTAGSVLKMKRWNEQLIEFILRIPSKKPLVLNGLSATGHYEVLINGVKKQTLTAGAGKLIINNIPAAKITLTIKHVP